MSTHPPHQAVIFPIDLGEASQFNRTIFPLSSYRKRDTIGRGDYYLDATLGEMLKITNIGANPQQCQELISATKGRYDQLMLQKAELQKRPKSRNPFKIFARYRATRLFLAASRTLYKATRSRSEEMIRSVGRGLLSVPGEDMEPVPEDTDIPEDAGLGGIVVRLDRPLDDIVHQQILDAANTIASYTGPFDDDKEASEASGIFSDQDSLASESLVSFVTCDSEEASDGTTTSVLSPSLSSSTTPSSPVPSSPTVIRNQYNFYGSIFSPHSSVTGGTAHFGGHDNSGSVNHIIGLPHSG